MPPELKKKVVRFIRKHGGLIQLTSHFEPSRGRTQLLHIYNDVNFSVTGELQADAQPVALDAKPNSLQIRSGNMPITSSYA